MILSNLRLALQLNNAKINKEINDIITYLNRFASNQKVTNYELSKSISEFHDEFNQTTINLSNTVTRNYTNLDDKISNLRDNYFNHLNDTVSHVTQADKDRWDASTSYTDTALREHVNNTEIHVTQELQDKWNNHTNDSVIHVTQEDKDLWNTHTNNLTIHVTQSDKDLWNATLQNAKDYAKSLFDRLTSFEIVKCTSLPLTNIKEMTIYFLQIDPEQNDLYEEYMYIDDKWEKIGNTRIDLSDYVTKELLQNTIDNITNTINTLRDNTNDSISNLNNVLNNNINTLNNNINNEIDIINNKINTKETLLKNIIYVLETKHNQDINNINNKILQLEQAFNNLDTELTQVHTHENKEVLDNLTQEIIDNSHTHENKDVLDKFSIDPKDNLLYDNKKVIDEFTEQDVQALIEYLWNIQTYNFLTKDDKYILTKDNKIFTAKEGGSL